MDISSILFYKIMFKELLLSNVFWTLSNKESDSHFCFSVELSFVEHSTSNGLSDAIIQTLTVC